MASFLSTFIRHSKGGRMKNLMLALLLAALAPTMLLASPADVGTLETVVRFDPLALETPENLLIDRSGTIYVSLALTGEIRSTSTSPTPPSRFSPPLSSRA
jgi:hypothetical protein